MLDLSNPECSALNDSSLVRCRRAARCGAIASVLYLDDDWERLTTQRAMLESAGYRVEATDSPAAGLSSYIRKGFDAVILDFHLPFVTNGLLAAVMRRFRRDIPLILVSDGSEFAETELGALDRQLPRETAQHVFLKNVYETVERSHEPAANPRPETADCLDREDQL